MSNKRKRPARSDRTQPAAKQTAKKGSARPWLLAGGVVVVVGLLAAVVLSGVETGERPSGIPEGTQLVPVGDPVHIDGDIDYGVLVPAGGPHNSVWLNCGYYGTPIRAENAVHSLEHASVWITVRPDADSRTLDELRGLAGRRQKLIVSPVPGQGPLLMATAWGHQLSLNSVDDPRLRQFVEEFENSFRYAPEPQAICFGGVGSPE
ncbi:MAG: DUF3105 domain-containing protein [Acidimicrobiia bacterium]